MSSGPRRFQAAAVAFLSALAAVAACRAASPVSPQSLRYAVTTMPIDTGVGSPAICVAVDQTDASGVWWWEPGPAGCATRSTGPAVFRGERGSVSPRPGTTAFDVQFQMQMITGPASTAPASRTVALVLQQENLLATASGARVAVARRADLEIPERP